MLIGQIQMLFLHQRQIEDGKHISGQNQIPNKTEKFMKNT